MYKIRGISIRIYRSENVHSSVLTNCPPTVEYSRTQLQYYNSDEAGTFFEFKSFYGIICYTHAPLYESRKQYSFETMYFDKKKTRFLIKYLNCTIIDIENSVKTVEKSLTEMIENY